MSIRFNKKFLYLTLFGIAMGFMEAAVVVYLRKIYYPAGFVFPLNIIPFQMLLIEQLREVSTLIMLVTAAWIAGRNFCERLACFLYIFAVWDIFYYIFLKAMLNWPASLLTWDILFLIPVTWIGPVLAPVVCSITMIVMAWLILYLLKKKPDLKIKTAESILVLLGCGIIFITFIYDFSKIIISGGFLSELATLVTDKEFQNAVLQFVPGKYNWCFFSIGELLILCGMAVFYRRNKPRIGGRA